MEVTVDRESIERLTEENRELKQWREATLECLRETLEKVRGLEKRLAEAMSQRPA